MKQKLLALLIMLGICTTQNVFAAVMAADEVSSVAEAHMRVLPYDGLSKLKTEVMDNFRHTGYIAIEGVPGFAEAYQNLIGAFRRFTELPADIQVNCTPADYFARGWSRGVEALIPGKKDTYKGSYYAWVPDDLKNPNVWPAEVPELKDAYMRVASIIMGVGQELLEIIGFDSNTRALGRMLHYKSVPDGEDDGNPNWCGLHRDHGLLTGLCPEVYFRNGSLCERPEGSGLYIEGNPVAPPQHLMLFQMGEVLELITNGAVRATDHWVQKPPKGDICERYSLAVFLDPLNEVLIRCSDPAVREKYADRFPLTEELINYEEWGKRSLAKYNPKDLAPKIVAEA